MKKSIPTMEITLLGPELELEEDTLIAICGGDLSPTINDIPIQNWRTILVKKGSKLKFGSVTKWLPFLPCSCRWIL